MAGSCPSIASTFGLAAGLHHLVGHRAQQRDATGGGALEERVLPDRHRGQVGGHRIAGRPRPGGATTLGFHSGAGAVGHRLHPLRRGDLEAEGGLVARVVVGRKPVAGPVRLGRDVAAHAGLTDPAQLAEGVRPAGLGRALVVDDHHHRLVGGQRRLGGEHQVQARPALFHLLSVDRRRGHRQAVQVEAQLVEVVGGAQRNGGHRLEAHQVVVHVEDQVVGGHVVAGVAAVGEVVIADPQCASSSTPSSVDLSAAAGSSEVVVEPSGDDSARVVDSSVATRSAASEADDNPAPQPASTVAQSAPITRWRRPAARRRRVSARGGMWPILSADQ
jgi:hypothetical protein